MAAAHLDERTVQFAGPPSAGIGLDFIPTIRAELNAHGVRFFEWYCGLMIAD
jgi:hypothetical protein